MCVCVRACACVCVCFAVIVIPTLQVPDMDVFNDYINETVVDLPFGKQDVSEGAIEHKGLNHTSYFEVRCDVNARPYTRTARRC